MKTVDASSNISITDYENELSLHTLLNDFRLEARMLAERLGDRTVWMVNSAAQGGGVAEMLPTMIGVLRQVGVDAKWAVMETEEQGFFQLTKHIHNLIHGSGNPKLDDNDRALYERVNQHNAQELCSMLNPDDIVIVHDPQPLGMAKYIRSRVNVKLVWRCHIGLDETTPGTDAASIPAASLDGF